MEEADPSELVDELPVVRVDVDPLKARGKAMAGVEQQQHPQNPFIVATIKSEGNCKNTARCLHHKQLLCRKDPKKNWGHLSGLP